MPYGHTPLVAEFAHIYGLDYLDTMHSSRLSYGLDGLKEHPVGYVFNQEEYCGRKHIVAIARISDISELFGISFNGAQPCSRCFWGGMSETCRKPTLYEPCVRILRSDNENVFYPELTELPPADGRKTKKNKQKKK